MGLFELFKKKNSGGVAKDRLKLLKIMYNKYIIKEAIKNKNKR